MAVNIGDLTIANTITVDENGAGQLTCHKK